MVTFFVSFPQQSRRSDRVKKEQTKRWVSRIKWNECHNKQDWSRVHWYLSAVIQNERRAAVNSKGLLEKYNARGFKVYNLRKRNSFVTLRSLINIKCQQSSSLMLKFPSMSINVKTIFTLLHFKCTFSFKFFISEELASHNFIEETDNRLIVHGNVGVNSHRIFCILYEVCHWKYSSIQKKRDVCFAFFKNSWV